MGRQQDLLLELLTEGVGGAVGVAGGVSRGSWLPMLHLPPTKNKMKNEIFRLICSKDDFVEFSWSKA